VVVSAWVSRCQARVSSLASEVSGNIPQSGAVHSDLPAHYWMSSGALLRPPVATSDLLHGLLSPGADAVICCPIARARFTSADVTAWRAARRRAYPVREDCRITSCGG
jgi:hypothetical protein